MRRISTVLAVVVASVIVVAGVAFAQEEETVVPEHADRPGAALTSSGDGTVSLDVDRGGLRLYVVGDVSIEGPADLDVVIESWEDTQNAFTRGGTSIELADFSGSVFVRGTGFNVDVDGHLTLHGHGTGTASLKGQGLWKTRSDKGVWPTELGFDG